MSHPGTVARRSDVRSLFIVGTHYAVVFTPVYLAAWFGPGWWLLLFWLWFGLLSQGALLVVHECAHKLLLRNIRLNELVAHWVLSPLFLADFEAFRRRHWAHHRELGRESDPKYTYRTDIAGWRFAWVVLSTLTLAAAVINLLHQFGERSERTSGSTWRTIQSIAVVQTTFLASLVATARIANPTSWTLALLSAAIAYGFVYLYGLASLTVLLYTLRGIAEHRRCDPNEATQFGAALRNFTHGRIERLIFGAYGFVDHATHHHHPGIPYYQLGEMTRQHAESDSTLIPTGSYFSVLARLIRRAPNPAAQPLHSARRDERSTPAI
jgi:fatty acid desaturase